MKTQEPPIHPLTQQEIYNKLWLDEKSVRAQIEKVIDALEYEIYEGNKQFETVKKLREEIKTLYAVLDVYSDRGYEEINTRIRQKFTVLSSLFKTINSATINTKPLSEILLMYANTSTYFTSCNAYEKVVSKEIVVRLCDVTGENKMKTELIAEEQASTVYKGVKEYESSYILAQLSGWFKQSSNRTNASLASEKRGTLSYPDLDSFIVTAPKPFKGTTRQVMKFSMGAWKQPATTEGSEAKRFDYPTGERKEFYKKITEIPSFVWPTNGNWTYKNTVKLFGSISFDSIKIADEANDSDKWKYLRKVINMIKMT